MQEFDYSNETSNDLYDAVDGLSYEEAVSAKAAIEKIKEEKEEKKVMKFKKWFNEALFPILNEFAAVSGCCLKIDQDACGGMTVTLRSKYRYFLLSPNRSTTTSALGLLKVIFIFISFLRPVFQKRSCSE